MTWKPKNVMESLVPLQIMFAIIGHGVFRYPMGRRRPAFSVIYAITVTLLYCVALGFTLNFCFNSDWFGTSEMIILYTVYINAVIAGLAQILSWYHGRMCSTLGAKLTKIDETLQELGATFDYNRCFNIGIAVVVFWLICIISLNAIDALWLINVIPVHQIIIVVTVLHHPFHINSIVVFYFSTAVRVIGLRFRKANEVLENIATPFQHRFIVKPFAMSRHQTLNCRNNRKNVIRIIKQAHLELSTISRELNQAYGVQMALEITAYFVMFTGEIYNLYTVIMNPTLDRRNIRIAVILCNGIAYFVKLIMINQACDEVSAEAHRTGEIIHCVHESDPELTDEIRQFSLQITQDPLFFSPGGFFTLGHKFVLGFFGTVTTYLVILMDFSGESTHRKKS